MPIARVGTEFQVNTITTGDQIAPQVIALSDGRFDVVWQTSTGWALQLYGSDGVAVGSEVDFAGAQPGAFAALPDGRLAYATYDEPTNATAFGILTAEGSESLAPVAVAIGLSAYADTVLRLASNASGEILLAASNDLSTSAVLLAADGSTSGPFALASADLAHQNHAAVDVQLGVAPDGAFLIVWDRVSEGTEAAYIFNGAVEPTFQLPDIPEGSSIALRSDDTIAFTSIADHGGTPDIGAGVYFDASGSNAHFIGTQATAPSDPHIYALTDGRELVTWIASSGGDGSGKSVMGHLVDDIGNPEGQDFVIESNVTGDQAAPWAAALADGRFVVTWQSPAIDGDGQGIAAQIFDPLHYTGTAIGDYWWGGTLGDSISGAGGADTLGGGAGADTIDGGVGNDAIFGGDGDDQLHGGADKDQLVGGMELDQIFGDGGNDEIDIVDGDDVAGETYDGGSGTDILFVFGGDGSYDVDLRDDTISGIETLEFYDAKFTAGGVGGSGTVHLNASQLPLFATIADGSDATAQNTLEITLGSVTTFDVGSIHLVDLDDPLDRVVVRGDNDAETIQGGSSNDVLDGGGGDDYLRATGHGTLRGGTGHDTLQGGVIDYSDATLTVFARSIDPWDSSGQSITVGGVQEDDVAYAVGVLGGSANDTFYGKWQVVDGGGGYDTVDFSSSSEGVYLSYDPILEEYWPGPSFSHVERFIAGNGADYLRLDPGVREVRAGGGADTVVGGGHDTLDGGKGADWLDYQDQTRGIRVTLAGSAFTYVSIGGHKTDFVRNFESVEGGTGADVIIGDSLNNAIGGGGGKDTLDGAGGKDTISFGLAGRVEVTLAGSSWATAKVWGHTGVKFRNFENVYGSDSNDKITGDSNANSLSGGDQDDRLWGVGGNDTLDGGHGRDTLTGGAGNDQFVFIWALTSDNVDNITDFQRGSDKIAIGGGGLINEAVGPLSSADFSVSATAGGFAKIRYNPNTGLLTYDEHTYNSTNHSFHYISHPIVYLQAHLGLAASDILII